MNESTLLELIKPILPDANDKKADRGRVVNRARAAVTYCESKFGTIASGGLVFPMADGFEFWLMCGEKRRLVHFQQIDEQSYTIDCISLKTIVSVSFKIEGYHQAQLEPATWGPGASLLLTLQTNDGEVEIKSAEPDQCVRIEEFSKYIVRHLDS